MKKFIYNNSNGLWYELHGDYYIPCLVLPDTEERSIGIWGRRHLDYIKKYRPMLYADLVLSCKLHSYLADIDAQAQAKLELLRLNKWQRKKVLRSSSKRRIRWHGSELWVAFATGRRKSSMQK